jgi:16S rRNA (uracil1498-N3)-methyltransferase
LFDRTARRLYLNAPLLEGAEVTLIDNQAHYVLNVLRQNLGDAMHLFNGIDGEWRGILTRFNKKSAIYCCEKQLREQPIASGVIFAFAPLKKERLEYMVQKAVEMGAGQLLPVFTQYTQNHKLDKCGIYAIEAAEQCGILNLPPIEKPLNFKEFLGFAKDKTLVFCDELAPIANPITALEGHDLSDAIVFIGPEGGFSEDERVSLVALPKVVRLSLGKNILRADTAAVAAMALIGAIGLA